jgi:cyclopropane-fatty-acyl-phospholipid synthase
MFEHVGKAHYRDFAALLNRCLAPDGLGLLHTIGQIRAQPINPWLERRIFPGAYLPTLAELYAVFEPGGFSVLDVENLRLHYAATLRHWLDRFERVAGEVEARFGAAFVRAWRLYLAASLTGFSSGYMQLFQVVFAPGTSNAVPWTRADLYRLS